MGLHNHIRRYVTVDLCTQNTLVSHHLLHYAQLYASLHEISRECVTEHVIRRSLLPSHLRLILSEYMRDSVLCQLVSVLHEILRDEQYIRFFPERIHFDFSSTRRPGGIVEPMLGDFVGCFSELIVLPDQFNQVIREDDDSLLPSFSYNFHLISYFRDIRECQIQSLLES